ncbi:hypothetical protein BO78DRAFT_438742 [Aspergillus sclerotiicarbonarius CBS 121057]|uniref:Uncharacterized protein n=1 Tax=Aspergillus sclerotiicarbonarius (strain CBS 121057 / IBT 28362) TaxID=1448318 RepID=A0A319EG52_ASPSB|nr:hypothetical protein BO78DRAFT_438742 [Aspergillus sclerotiicarbonarius CBS 121057]
MSENTSAVNIKDLPQELIDLICNNMDPSSYAYLRGTCKHLEGCLDSKFLDRVQEHALERKVYHKFTNAKGAATYMSHAVSERCSRYCALSPKEEASQIEFAIQSNSYRLVQSYLNAGLDANLKDLGGETSLLFQAAAHGNVDLVKLLLERGARTRLSSGELILDVLAEEHRRLSPGVARALIDSGARFSTMATFIEICQMHNGPQLVELALKRGLDIHHTYPPQSGLGDRLLGNTPVADCLGSLQNAKLLHIAALCGNPKIVDIIVSGAPDQLHAVDIGQPPMEYWLYDNTTDYSVEPSFTPVILAVYAKRASIALRLLQSWSPATPHLLETAFRQCTSYSPSLHEWSDIIEMFAAQVDMDTPEAPAIVRRCVRRVPVKNGQYRYRSWNWSAALLLMLKNISPHGRSLFAKEIDIGAYERCLAEIQMDKEHQERLEQESTTWPNCSWNALNREEESIRGILELVKRETGL